MGLREDVTAMKDCSPEMMNLSGEIRNKALQNIVKALQDNREMIFRANEEDLKAAVEDTAPAVMKRLRFDEHKMSDVIAGIEGLIGLPDPVGQVQLKRELDGDLLLERIACPIGVIGVIFEARPDALVQIASLCIKSGNCAVLKGGRETARSNEVLFGLIHDAACQAGVPQKALMQATLHSEIDELLSCDDCVDLLIPRGSNAFVQYIMKHTLIPVMGHADGVCHTYWDAAFSFEKMLPIVIDAKTQYAAACNATETLLVNCAHLEEMPRLYRELERAGIVVYGTEAALKAMEMPEDAVSQYKMDEDSFHQEYLSHTISVKIVADTQEAVRHINHFGSHHTDAILTDDDKAAEYFMDRVDSAGVYRNCSTRFADGFRYGFGAEVGISTSKLHARGPVGLEGLMTYKYKMTGNGNLVADYAAGRKSFHFKDLKTE